MLFALILVIVIIIFAVMAVSTCSLLLLWCVLSAALSMDHANVGKGVVFWCNS